MIWQQFCWLWFFFFLREVAAFPAEFVRSDNKVADDNYQTKPDHEEVWWPVLMYFLSTSYGQALDELMTHMETRTWWAKLEYLKQESLESNCPGVHLSPHGILREPLHCLQVILKSLFYIVSYHEFTFRLVPYPLLLVPPHFYASFSHAWKTRTVNASQSPGPDVICRNGVCVYI